MNFFIALTVAALAVSGGSLFWPRLTDRPRPKFLTDVKNIVLKTPTGRNAAFVLGVSDENKVKPIDVGQAAGTALGEVKGTVQDRIQTMIVGNAVNQLHQQFEKLSSQQKEQIREIICKPLEDK